MIISNLLICPALLFFMCLMMGRKVQCQGICFQRLIICDAKLKWTSHHPPITWKLFIFCSVYICTWSAYTFKLRAIPRQFIQRGKPCFYKEYYSNSSSMNNHSSKDFESLGKYQIKYKKNIFNRYEILVLKSTLWRLQTLRKIVTTD